MHLDIFSSPITSTFNAKHLDIFSSPITSTFNAMHLDESPFTCQCQKEDKKASEFQISHFYWSFSSDIIAVKGLSAAHLADCTNVSLSFAGKKMMQNHWGKTGMCL